MFSIFLMFTYAVNLSVLMGDAGHVDFFGAQVVNRIFYLLTAIALESMVLIFVINGMVLVGRGYAIASFFINLLYYDHFDATEWRLFIASILLSTIHSGAIFWLADLFKKQTQEARTHKCQICGDELASKDDLERHLSISHKLRSRTQVNDTLKILDK